MTNSHKQVIFIIEEKINPSTDYFIAPALMDNRCQIIRCDFSILPGAPNELDHAIVIFIRYIPEKWAKFIETNRGRLKALIFFMDDDVLDLNASIGMPWRYRYKLAHLSVRRVNWLKRQRAELWVSTAYLQKKYAVWQPKLILPSPMNVETEYIKVFYHGSASHKAEIEWLHPIVDKLLAQNRNICFEIIGGADVNRLYKNVERVTVIHPMKWSSYQAFIAAPGRHIGLAPLLNIPFNHARSYTKFFDIHRCGAVGIFSPQNACAEIIEHNKDGMIVELDPQAWINTIDDLANNKPLRDFLRTNAEIKQTQLRIDVRNAYANLFKD